MATYIQNSYSRTHTQAYLGQVEYVRPGGLDAAHLCADGQTIAAGDLVELDANGNLRKCQSTGTSAKIFGIAAYTSAKEPVGQVGQTPNTDEYGPNMQVPVVRNGRVWSKWTGSTTAAFAALVNLSHSSTTAANQGAATDSATSTTVGSEISGTIPGVEMVRNDSATTAGMVLLQINLPA